MSWQLSHLVNNSWWPLLMSFGSFSLMSSILFWLKFHTLAPLMCSVCSSLLLMFLWLQDVVRESTYQGNHTALVMGGLKWGLVWFLFSEVWFFFSIFWTFFHYSLAPMSGGWYSWPNFEISIIPPFQVPLLNTIILLMSGVTATLAHHELIMGHQSIWIPISVVLGLYFLSLQMIEYFSSSYTLSSGSYGSVFFFGTGFHGLHVCLGTIMLVFSMLRSFYMNLSSHHHFGLEFSLWYWHFVDVVWLFLFFWVYAWGS